MPITPLGKILLARGTADTLLNVVLTEMKRKHKVAMIVSTPIVAAVLAVGGFALQHVIAPFSGVDRESDGSRTEYRFYLAITPSFIKAKWGSGFFTRVRTGRATSCWTDGTLCGQWTYDRGARDGTVTIYRNGAPWQCWKEDRGAYVEGSAVAFTGAAEEDFSQQGVRHVRK